MTERPMPPQTTTTPTLWKAYTVFGPQLYVTRDWMEWRKAKDAELAANPEPHYVVSQRIIINLENEDGTMPRKGRACKAPGCTNRFIPASASSKTCSAVCSGKYLAMKSEEARDRYWAKRAERPPVVTVCAEPGCGKEFTPNRANHVICSDACRRKRNARAQRRGDRVATCSECATVFETTHPTKKTCSTKCSDARGKRLERQSKEGGEG